MTYAEKLKDPRWQKKRLEVMQRFGFECSSCGSKENTLNIHHKIYIKNKEPWEYQDHMYDCLCSECHKAEHKTKERLNHLLANARYDTILEVIGFLSFYEWDGLNIKLKSYEELVGFFKCSLHQEAQAKAKGFIEGR